MIYHDDIGGGWFIVVLPTLYNQVYIFIYNYIYITVCITFINIISSNIIAYPIYYQIPSGNFTVCY